MPTRIGVTARLIETNESFGDSEQLDNRRKAIESLADDISYSQAVGPRGFNVDSGVEAVIVNGPDRVPGTDDQFSVDVEIPDSILPVEAGGLQHLIGILAGDALPSSTGTIRWEDAEVTKLELSAQLRADAVAQFRAHAWPIDRIRSEFKLPIHRPLLAFSMKPRVGVDLTSALPRLIDLARTGFNVVEFDTRRIEDPRVHHPDWLDLHRTMVEESDGRCAFAPNLSVRTDIALEAAARWVEEAPRPHVVKVDGGLDGLSTVQAIREHLGETQPIVTCYPSLRGALSGFVGGPDTWVDLLSISGVDIIYPGGGPNFNETRRVGGETTESSAERARRRYAEIIETGWPMPSFAAGATAGELHAAIHLLGGETALFLGRAMTDTKGDFKSTAELIARIADFTAGQISSSSPNDPVPKLDVDFYDDYEKFYPLETLVTPSMVFGDAPGLAKASWQN